MSTASTRLRTEHRLWHRVSLTIGLSILCLVTAGMPALQQALQFDTATINNGEVWRLLTGHLTHWNADHFIWDFGVFLFLGCLCECRSRMAFVLTTAASAVSISAWLMLGQSDITVYRGLSGIDTGLFSLCGVQLLEEAWQRRDRLLQGLAGLALFGLGLKVSWEFLNQATIFVDHISADFVPIPMAHVAGGVCGFVIGVLCLAAQHCGDLLRLSECEATARPTHV